MNDDVLIHYLLSIPGVSALVDTRGYPYGRLPQKVDGQITAEMPAFTVNSISETSHHAIADDGRPALSCFQRMRFQADLYGEVGADVARLSRAVRLALDGFTGKMSEHEIGGAWGRVTTPVQQMPENLLFHRTMDFEIHVMS